MQDKQQLPGDIAGLLSPDWNRFNTIPEQPVFHDETPELDSLKVQINRYQEWIKSEGAHSKQGKFYRAVIGKLTKQINELTKHPESNADSIWAKLVSDPNFKLEYDNLDPSGWDDLVSRWSDPSRFNVYMEPDYGLRNRAMEKFGQYDPVINLGIELTSLPPEQPPSVQTWLNDLKDYSRKALKFIKTLKLPKG